MGGPEHRCLIENEGCRGRRHFFFQGCCSSGSGLFARVAPPFVCGLNLSCFFLFRDDVNLHWTD